MATASVSRPKSRMASARPEPERFSYLLAADTVPDTGLDAAIEADEAGRRALASQAGVLAVQSFEASFHVGREGRDRFKVSGRLHARVTQTCVVSLEPFESEIAADICVEFAPSGSVAAEKLNLESNPPDPVVDGQIDLGALAAEFLVLNLDPYPRKAGAVFEEPGAGAGTDKKDSPFAVLLRR
ncbi:MAG: DUF177 domain-containing protein [Methylocapsa sp.]|nr:DUF177 domain-containing protein [Methylocapsa sp.]